MYYQPDAELIAKLAAGGAVVRSTDDEIILD